MEENTNSESYTRRKGNAPSGKVVNRLNIKEMFALIRWLEDLQPTFDETTTKEALAVKASNHFKITVNAFNIRTALETAEIKLPEAPKSEAVKMGIMKRAIEHLYSEVGMQLPSEWSDL